MQTRLKIIASLAFALFVFVGGHAFAADEDDTAAGDDPGVRLLPKANKSYVVDGETLSFVDLENRLTANKPTRIVIEFSRQTKSASCAIMLGIEIGVPIWTRSYNGRMKRLQIDANADDLKNIERCR